MAQPGNCYRHPHAVASDTCPQCGESICEYCLTLISGRLAGKLGLPAGDPFEAWYGYRMLTGRLVILSEVTWGNAKARQVEAMVVDGPPFFTDGILGRSFLLRFTGRYNEDRSQLTLSPRVFTKAKPTPVVVPDPDDL